jgi:hypothetical protein
MAAASQGAGPAAPGVFELLADGSTAEIRAATPQDFAAVRVMHEEMCRAISTCGSSA